MELKKEFALKHEVIYLNHAAVSPWPRRTAEAVMAFATENVSQGSLNYPGWLETEQRLREQAAQLINAPSADDIALVKNTSEGLSLVAYGLQWQPGESIVISNQEFPSNRIVWESLQNQGVEVRAADLSTSESPEDALFRVVDKSTRLIAVSSVQYATGLRMDVGKIGEFCQSHGLLFCLDAIQSVGAIRTDVQAAHADFLAADGHKWMLGPEGLGIFYVRPELREQLKLRQFGWHMLEDVGNFDREDWKVANSARRFECGSPNMLGIHALQASLSLLVEYGMESVEAAVLERSRYLMDLISASKPLELITPTEPSRFAGIVTVRHRERPASELFQQLQHSGVFCAQRGGGIRFSPHFYTPFEHLDKAVQALLDNSRH